MERARARGCRSSTNGTLLTSPDGTAVLTGSPRGRKQLLVSTGRRRGAQLFRSPDYCAPVRAWDQTRVLETCGASELDLVLFDPTHGEQDAADRRARRAPTTGTTTAGCWADRLYVEVQAACASYLGRREDDGTVSRVRIPGQRGQAFLVGTAGSDLVVQRTSGCRGSDERAGLSLFDPVTRVERVLAQFGKREELSDVHVLGETRAITY